MVEGEAEIVAGHMVEYSGMAFAMFFLAEYARHDRWCPSLPSIMFLGGWLAPVDALSLHPGLDLVGIKTLRGRHDVPVGACHVPSLPL